MGVLVALLPAFAGTSSPARGGLDALVDVGPGELELAASSTLCTGYAGCRDRGYSDHGYGARSGQMYWRMYSGHNCTNYVAYRMIRAGMSAERPWSGSGNASNWGHAMSDITDRTPAVGAVAWWDRNVSGAGSAGHVAIVERVISRNEIIVSQDSWGGDFSWARLTNDGSRWPTGFIHFVDKTLENTTQPSIAGRPTVGRTLTARPGRWSESGAQFAYQWRADGVDIPGATQKKLPLDRSHVGKRLNVLVSASKPGLSSGTRLAQATEAVAAGTLTSTQAPTLSGEPRVGQVLTATRGTWSPTPAVDRVRWTSDGERIPGAIGTQLEVTRDLAGTEIRAVQVAKLPGYTAAEAPSNPLGPVVVGEIEVSEEPQVTGTPRVGEQLTLDPGRWTPSAATATYRWLRDGVAVPGQTGSTYDVTDADLGGRLAAEVTVSRTGFTDVVRRAPATQVVRTTADVTVRATSPKSGRARVVVVVGAGSAAVDAGQVRIAVGGKRTVVDLVDGRAVARLDGLAAGRHDVAARYLGSDVVDKATGRTVVRVLR